MCAGLSLLKRDANTGVFTVNIAKFLRTPILKNHLRTAVSGMNHWRFYTKKLFLKMSQNSHVSSCV